MLMLTEVKGFMVMPSFLVYHKPLSPEVHVVDGVDDDVDELHASHHVLDLEGLRVDKVGEQRLEAVGLGHLQLEVVERRKNDVVAVFD